MSTRYTRSLPAGSTADPAVPRPAPRRDIAVFLLVAFAGNWLLWTPVVLGWLPSGPGLVGTDATPVALAISATSMFTPALGVLVATRRLRRPASLPGATGLTSPCPRGRLIGYCALALALFPAINLGTLAAGSLLGLYKADLTGLSGLREALDIAPGTPVLWPALATAAVLFLVGVPLMVGEEWGWRGYLEPRLQPLGLLPMVLISGLIWGLWHLPVAFLGDREPLLWLPAYVVDCTLSGALLCWLRLRTHSIWPAVVGHAAISGFPGAVITVWLHDMDRPFDAFAVEVLGGWVSWVLKAAVLLVIVAVGGFRPWSPPVPARPGTGVCP
ncbi:CPBP family intramembrane glutamic endopeptidase [Nonomuraea sp. NPDC050783]|uniref:CPBP family intramembrane glutamic endopeptidase n=1 Tax=Nonomuraea sp. NPDC050783 TaxID=3154634 RepID=UPI0034658D53